MVPVFSTKLNIKHMKKLALIPGVAALMMSGAFAQDTVATAQPDPLPLWEMIVFCVVVVGVIALGIIKSGAGKETEEQKEESGAADYFLAGRGLSWWLVGFSLLAANISTEQFVGMSGQAADWLGLAIAGYEWLAAIVLVIVAFSFLPMLLKRGVFTIPQFLEERFNGVSRVTMAVVNLLILVGVPTAAVIYAGSTVVSVYFNVSVTTGCIIMAACATVYVYVGGLKACAWTDLIWGAALIVGGGVVAYFAVMALGGMETVPQAVLDTAASTSTATADTLAATGNAFTDGLNRMWELNAGGVQNSINGIGGKLHMMREASDPVMPWTVYLLGLWIPNFFYWGLNQYIMQRTLASKSLEEGQMGIVFAAFLKLLIPFVVIIPGILAYNLFHKDLANEADKTAVSIVAGVTEDGTKTGKKVIYQVDKSRLIREDSSSRDMVYYADANNDWQLADNGIAPEGTKALTVLSGVNMILSNAETVGATNEQKEALAIAVTNLQKTDKNLTADGETAASVKLARAEAAIQLLKVNNEIVAPAIADTEHYTTATSVSGYQNDKAFATLLKKLLPGTGWAWFVLAALFGAVVSSLASMLNSASTLFTMDIYGKAKEVAGTPATNAQLVWVGKAAVLVCALIATILAPFLDNPAFGGIFTFIQEFQGFLSPGVLTVFLFGFFVPFCPRVFGWLGIALGAVAYAICKWAPVLCEQSFLNRMAYSFLFVCLIGLILTLVNMTKGGEKVILEDKGILEMKTSGRAKIFGALVVLATIALYIIFW